MEMVRGRAHVRLVTAMLTAWWMGAASACSNGSGGNPPSGNPGGGSSGQSACPQGALGCACTAASTCEETLVCQAGVCAPPGCTTGTAGCPCDSAGACADAALECSSTRTCVPRACEPGTLACSCLPTGGCAEALSCVGGSCRPADAVEVSSEGSAVRACDVVLRAGARDIRAVVFGPGVRGEWVRRGPRVAFAVHALTDAAPGTLAWVQLEGTGAAAPMDVTLVSATCHDRMGAPLAGPAVQLR